MWTEDFWIGVMCATFIWEFMDSLTKRIKKG
jgi:hypothetical protein